MQATAKQGGHVGPYREQDMDAALRRTLQSDPWSLAMRGATLVVVYVLLGRAVVNGLPAVYLLLPLAVEFVFLMWLGLLMAHTVVPCRTFRASTGSGVGVVVWTVLLTAAALAWLAHGDDGLSPQRIPAAAQHAGEVIVDAGLHWAMLAGVLGLLAGSVHEVIGWRRRRGVFVWTSITAIGFRIGLAVLLLFVGGLAAVFAWPLLAALLGSPAINPAWVVWTLLLLLDVGVLVVSALMHRDLLRQADAAGPAAGGFAGERGD